MKKLKVFSRKKSKGLATAFLLGLINSNGKYVGWVDSNMGQVVKRFPDMLKELDNNDIVILSRYVPGGNDERGRFRVIVSFLLNKFTKFVLRSKINDLSSGIFFDEKNCTRRCSSCCKRSWRIYNRIFLHG